MADVEEDNVPPIKKCWNCGWVIPDCQFNNLLNHTCFAGYNEDRNGIIISNDGIVSLTVISKKRQKLSKELRFLHKIKDYPALFCSKERRKMSKENLSNIWKMLANSLPGYDVETAKKEWKNLRDQFQRSVDPLKFRHYNIMKYFDDYTCDEANHENGDEPLQNEAPSSESNFTPQVLCTGVQNVQSNDEQERGRSGSIDEVRNSDIVVQNSTITFENGKKRKLSKHNLKHDLQNAILEKISSHTLNKPDQVDMFLLSVAPMFKKLNDARQLRVYRMLIQIIEEELNIQES
ncbi:uncharacterized protein LOC122500721 isoform X2 [Leptopilina heterotoma]|uniref:uncharacterized protein LOC122500721 isoform X2 n=1 Tax=Leptopilina heterotoma TaxID=63436 RepID=UPI001CA92DA7|nr:uncharacterized protein LOC122500721 isoform X2 [Leptopilina heterotoma]